MACDAPRLRRRATMALKIGAPMPEWDKPENARSPCATIGCYAR
jgi:hypothetical protein